MKIKVFTILIFTAALFMAACGKSDTDLQKAAADKLAADKVTGVTVAVNSGVATLTGEVADITVKNKAATDVKSVEGIKSVTDNTTLKPVPTPEAPAMDDQKMEGTIKEAVRKAGAPGVTVTVANGEVTLTGDVSKDKLAAVIGAASVNNPKRIINQLKVK